MVSSSMRSKQFGLLAAAGVPHATTVSGVRSSSEATGGVEVVVVDEVVDVDVDACTGTAVVVVSMGPVSFVCS